MCGNITKALKNTSRTHCNFPGILQEILACIGVQITRKWVRLATKFKNSMRKLKAHGYRVQTHGSDGSGSG